MPINYNKPRGRPVVDSVLNKNIFIAPSAGNLKVTSTEGVGREDRGRNYLSKAGHCP